MAEDLREVAQICEEELQVIRYFKLKEIQKAWDDLFAIGLAPVLYEKNPNYVDYTLRMVLERISRSCGEAIKSYKRRLILKSKK